jgi:transcriptional regulator with XRE-family HTH domain
MPQEAPFLVRRARLVKGMKQAAFAEMFGVDTSTVSRWERGLAKPSAQVMRRIREIVLRSQSLYSEALIQASHVYKYVVPVNDLTHPCLLSQGVLKALARAGVMRTQLKGDWWHDMAKKSQTYEISVVRALKIIEADEAWRSGNIAYAEAHCLAPKLLFWVNLMVAPLPERHLAIIETMKDPEGEADGFWVRLHPVEELVEAQKSY